MSNAYDKFKREREAHEASLSGMAAFWVQIFETDVPERPTARPRKVSFRGPTNGRFRCGRTFPVAVATGSFVPMLVFTIVCTCLNGGQLSGEPIEALRLGFASVSCRYFFEANWERTARGG